MAKFICHSFIAIYLSYLLYHFRGDSRLQMFTELQSAHIVNGYTYDMYAISMRYICILPIYCTGPTTAVYLLPHWPNHLADYWKNPLVIPTNCAKLISVLLQQQRFVARLKCGCENIPNILYNSHLTFLNNATNCVVSRIKFFRLVFPECFHINYHLHMYFRY